MTKYYVVGKIVNTHGVRGEVRVISTTDFPDERYKKGNQLYLEDEAGMVALTVENHRRHKQFDLLQFVGLNNINDVIPFKGKKLNVPEEQLTDLVDEHEFYFHEIIGCTVTTDEGIELGIIKEILTPGANDVWVVKQKGGKEVLIPYIEDVVKQVDVEKKQITIHVMEGLLD